MHTAANGAATENVFFNGLETFANAGGTISLVDGDDTDRFTIAADVAGAASYVGSGDATLFIDVGGDGAGLTADRLIVNGNVSGTTTVDLNLLLPQAAIVDPDGVLIVDAVTATGTPFVLGTPQHAGFIDYSLLQSGADTFLISSPNAGIFDIGTLSNFAQDLWYQGMDTQLECSASRRNRLGTAKPGFTICAQIYWSRDRYGDSNNTDNLFGTDLTFSDRLRTTRKGAQADIGFIAAPKFAAGVIFGYAHARASHLASGAEFDADGHNYGVYAQYAGQTGLHAGAIVQISKFSGHAGNADRFAVEPKWTTSGIDGELGWRTPTFGPMLDVNAGVTVATTNIHDFTAGFIDFDFSDRTSVRGRIGARLGWNMGILAPYVDAHLYHEFKDHDSIGITSGLLTDDIRPEGRGTWGRLEAGLDGGPGGGPLLSVWGDFGNVKGFGARAGFRF